jgi:hypothetical protein
MPTTVPRADPIGEALAFAHRLVLLSADDIHRLSKVTPVGDDVAWWDAVAAVEDRLRGAHLLRQAGVVGRMATQAVFGVANRAGLDIDRQIVVIAHAAGDAARALVAGGSSMPEAEPLLAPWATLGLLLGRRPLPLPTNQ